MADTVAIDFETANERRGSPCSVGYAVISGLDVVESGAFLIQPPEMRFAGFNVSLHGITPAMCGGAPAWPEALERLEAIVATSLVLAHYTPFDIGVIRDTCADTGVLCPELHFACTRSLARMVWPGLASYCLPDIAAAAGVVLTSHHDAESDAVAAAGVAIAAAKLLECGSVPEIYTKVGFYPGTLQGGIYTRSTTPSASQRVPRIASDGVILDHKHPSSEQDLVFTGGMMSMTRHDAQQAVVGVRGAGHDLGGQESRLRRGGWRVPRAARRPRAQSETREGTGTPGDRPEPRTHQRSGVLDAFARWVLAGQRRTRPSGTYPEGRRKLL
jgi:DNA polymerase-3 subunit epsilon